MDNLLMKFKSLLLSLFYFFPITVSAHWVNVGKTDYNWGPFHVYSIFLYTETGRYQDGEFPLMLSFKYAKPVEGKNFAITLIKEIDKLKNKETNSRKWLEQLQQILPDLSPNDTLSYIALQDKGYFVLNDTILAPEFDIEFNQAFTAIWLSPNSHFIQMRKQLLDNSRPSSSEEYPSQQPETAPLDDDNNSPELPPNYQLHDRHKGMS